MLTVVMTWLGVAGIKSILSHDINCYYNGFRTYARNASNV